VIFIGGDLSNTHKELRIGEARDDKINERVRVFADAREIRKSVLAAEEHGAAALTGPSNDFSVAYVFILINSRSILWEKRRVRRE